MAGARRNALPLARAVLLTYMAAIAAGELITALADVRVGVTYHAVLLVVLLNHFLVASEMPHRQTLPILALLPLLRIVSLTMPFRPVPQLYWPALVGVPLLLAVGLTARLLRWPRAKLMMGRAAIPAQALIAANGVPLGAVAYLIYHPKLLVPSLSLGDLVIASLILVVFTGFLEELIFRGLLQQAANDALGPVGTLAGSALFMSMYVSSLSPGYVLFVGLAGLFFGVCVNRTQSIWGVAAAHSLMAIGMLLVWPAVWP